MLIATINLIKALAVRGGLVLHALLTIWRVTVTRDDTMWWLLSILLFPSFLEALFTLIKRKGKEFKWFTPCFFNYLLVVVPCVWLMELEETDNFIDGTDEQESARVGNTTIELDGLDLDPATWNILVEELMLYMLIIGRWLLPRGDVTRDQLSELLFAFLGMAGDITTVFALFSEEKVRSEKYMAYWILATWSVSVLQLTMTVTVTYQPKRAKKIMVIEDDEDEDHAHKVKKMWAQILAILMCMAMQDVPFMVIRLYCITTFDLVNYAQIFFTTKNLLVIALLLYKMVSLCQTTYCPDTPEDDSDVESAIVEEGAAPRTITKDSMMLKNEEMNNGGKKNGARTKNNYHNDNGELKRRKKAQRNDEEGEGRLQPLGASNRRGKQHMPTDPRPFPITLPEDLAGSSRGPKENSDTDSIYSVNFPSTSRSNTDSLASRQSKAVAANEVARTDSRGSADSRSTSKPKKGQAASEVARTDSRGSSASRATNKSKKSQGSDKASPVGTSERKSPVISTPTQTAKPGDEDFQPYVTTISLA